MGEAGPECGWRMYRLLIGPVSGCWTEERKRSPTANSSPC